MQESVFESLPRTAMQMAWEVLEKKLYLASAVLKIPTWQVYILDHQDLQDGFGKVWDWNLLSSIIDKEISAHSIDLIITFDEYGISGHCNHRNVHQGVRCLRTGQSHCLLNLYPRRSYNAMAQHSSQWVWYRKLFVAFSSYTYVNTLKKIAS
ncbi:N-acetylglucosaminyl-phosphatidylinositol de-N-acetylase [Sesamum angolense]|uniref:N-acetylglucosaminylphosphatidylinositol deacetylase n=1 Tax=Sesamum angolense TaxID=2727404 RepID=A0AAE2BRU3_9LAMI|nr:N-acetylglucosaminyl-phosphatidylinositol de-N-acetylase [Sesamum angolense]